MDKKKFFFILFLVIAFMGFLWVNTPARDNPLLIDDAKTSQSPTPTEAPEEEKIGVPTRLKIPAINVDAPVESVAQDSAGRMDVPKNSRNVAWYNLGYYPGQIGSAVMSGHLDNRDGSRAVFWDLEKLKSGDELIVTDSQGKEYVFEVTKVVKYKTNEVPLKDVFASHGTEQLNLITCEGTFIGGIYDHRLVVYSESK